MRKLTVKDFDTTHEYEQYKREIRKADVTRRVSNTGRRSSWNLGDE